MNLDLDFKLPALVISLAWYGALAAIALRRREPDEVGAEWLVLYSVSAGLWSFIQFGSRLGWLTEPGTAVVARVPLYAALVLTGLLLQVNRVFLRVTARSWVGWTWLGAFVAAGLFLELNPFRWPDPVFAGLGLDLVIRVVLVVGWGVMLGGAAWLTLQAYRRTPQPLHRNRIAYWAPTLAISAVGDGLLIAQHRTLGTACLMVAAGVAGYTLLTHRLVDIRQAARRTLTLTLTALVMAAGYGFAFGLAWAALRPAASPYSVVLAATLLALAAAVMFPPLRRWIARPVNRWIAHADYEPARLVREYSSGISNILDVGQLARTALTIISDGLGARHAALFLVDRKRDATGDYFSLRLAEDTRDAPAGAWAAGQLAADSPVADFLYKEYRPLPQYDIDLLARFRALAEAERAWLASLEADVYVPIYAKGAWIGLFALGAKRSGDRYFDEDLELLSTLADQTTVALENARLVENLVALNRTLREAYTALDQASQRLEHLDQAKSDFIAVLSHELRTPLGILLGYSQMLSDDPDFKRQPGHQTIIDGLNKGASRLQEIIESMLDMAQIDNRQLKLYRRPVALLPILQAVTTQFMTALQQRRLTLTLDDGLAALPKIEADTETLGKVFYQLVVNAIKYTPDGGRITLSGQFLPEGTARLPAGGVEVVVADTGIGIDPRYQELVFAKFYQTGEVALHSSGKTKFKGGGPGLGLAIARGIVEAHGGQIRVESPGYDEARCPGSRFYVTLPLRQPAVVTPP